MIMEVIVVSDRSAYRLAFDADRIICCHASPTGANDNAILVLDSMDGGRKFVIRQSYNDFVQRWGDMIKSREMPDGD